MESPVASHAKWNQSLQKEEEEKEEGENVGQAYVD